MCFLIGISRPFSFFSSNFYIKRNCRLQELKLCYSWPSPRPIEGGLKWNYLRPKMIKNWTYTKQNLANKVNNRTKRSNITKSSPKHQSKFDKKWTIFRLRFLASDKSLKANTTRRKSDSQNLRLEQKKLLAIWDREKASNPSRVESITAQFGWKVRQFVIMTPKRFEKMGPW